jgi:hypothetical protein
MIAISDFCWRDFSPLRESDPTVGALYDIAQRHLGSYFVLHDPVHLTCSLAIPEVITHVVDVSDLSRNERAAGAGLLSVLSHEQIWVHRSQPAEVVARLVASTNSQVVIAVEDDGSPTGVFIPSVVMERLPNTSLVRSASPQLQQAVNQFLGSSDLVSMIQAIQNEYPGFHSENLNQHRPDPFVCDDHGKPHILMRCPCDVHPGAACGRRS